MKKIVVTGATGFIGSNLIRKLIKDGHDVHLFVRPMFKQWRIADALSRVKIHVLDLESKESLEKALKRIKPQWLFHLATYGGYPSQKDLNKIIATNIIGTVNFMEAAVVTGFESFINIGSSSEYGFKDHPVKENEPLEPNSHYALSKAYMTMFARDLAVRNKLNIITLRPYSVYGAYEEPGRFIPTIIIKGLNGEWPPLVRPEIARDYIHVDDFIKACILAAKYKGKDRGLIFNAGCGKQITIKEVVELAAERFDIKIKPKWRTMPDRIWDTEIWVGNNNLIKDKLHWQCKTSFKNGFVKTLEWFRNNPDIRRFYEKEIR
jgi:nucleoside-diphosphate-sugar epimerase